jgi:glycosyltransferase involved in cell wall biosynthesis
MRPTSCERTLRVLAVIETLSSGGAEHALLGLLGALAGRGHSCQVAVLWPPYDLAADFEATGIAVHRLGLSHRWNVPQGVWRLRDISRRMRPDVIHAHLFFAGLYVAGTRVFDPRPARMVTFHNLGYDSYPARTLWLRVRKRIDRTAMRHGVDRRLAVSRAVAEHYAGHLGLSQVSVVPNGLDLKQLATHPRRPREEVRAMYGVRADESVLLLAGTLRKEKGHRFLLQALARIRESGVTPRLLLAGAGPLERGLRAQTAALGLDGQVTFLGRLEHPELLDLIASVDLVVMPSTHEGASVAASEAICLGTPLLASAVGGLNELANHAGVRLIRPSDPVLLGVEIARALKHPLDGQPSSTSSAPTAAAADLLDIGESAQLLEAEYIAALSSR